MNFYEVLCTFIQNQIVFRTFDKHFVHYDWMKASYRNYINIENKEKYFRCLFLKST